MNGLYELIDEDFINMLIPNARIAARHNIYSFYEKYSRIFYKSTHYNEDSFLINADKHKLKLIQCYCPYCGNIKIIPHSGKWIGYT